MLFTDKKSQNAVQDKSKKQVCKNQPTVYLRSVCTDPRMTALGLSGQYSQSLTPVGFAPSDLLQVLCSTFTLCCSSGPSAAAGASRFSRTGLRLTETLQKIKDGFLTVEFSFLCGTKRSLQQLLTRHVF